MKRRAAGVQNSFNSRTSGNLYCSVAQTRLSGGLNGLRFFHGRLMKARITVTLREMVLDPQGKAIEGALKSLGFEGIHNVRQGKVFDLDIDVSDRSNAEAILKQACLKLLANTVIENFKIEIA